MTVSPERFREVMRQFATGVTVVGTAHEGQIRGMTVNAFTSVSLEPLQVLVCISDTAGCHPLIVQSGVFSINVLAENQHELARSFADHSKEDVHRFAGIPYRTRLTGAPLLDGAAACLECKVVESVHSGDHTIFIGEVKAAEMTPGARPLLFLGGQYAALGEYLSEGSQPAARRRSPASTD